MIELNKIYCWDCLEVMKQIPEKSIDLILTDPPYEFISKNPRGWWVYGEENMNNLNDIKSNFGMTFNPTEFLREAKRVCKKMNTYIWTNKNLLYEYIGFAKENNYAWDIIIWIKNNPVPAFNGKYLNDKEYCIYIREKWATFNTIKWGYENYFTRYKDSTWNREFDHPTVKPLHMIKRQLSISSNEWDLILDPFLWSWTTAVACKEMWRNFIGIEKKKKYVDIANKRLATTTISLF